VLQFLHELPALAAARSDGHGESAQGRHAPILIRPSGSAAALLNAVTRYRCAGTCR
jgi:hypothetical protein